MNKAIYEGIVELPKSMDRKIRSFGGEYMISLYVLVDHTGIFISDLGLEDWYKDGRSFSGDKCFWAWVKKDVKDFLSYIPEGYELAIYRIKWV